MALRIRKEVQDKLKASLSATPEGVFVSREAIVADAGTSDRPASVPARPKRKPAATVKSRDRKSVTKKLTRTTAGKARAAARKKPKTRIARVRNLPAEHFAGEIESIHALFDILILHTADPAQLLALRSMTERYLADQPTREKLDQVRILLQRQAAQLRREREAIQNQSPHHAKPTIDAVALPAAESADIKTDDAVPKPAPVSTPAAPILPPEAKRRTILSWLSRKGGGGNGGGGGGDKTIDPDDPSIQKNPIRARIKTAMMATIWVGVGLSTLTYAASLAYVNYMRLEIDTAMISGSVEPINAPFDGSIASLLVKGGDRLSEGARFAVMEDPEIEKQTRFASVKVERAREDLRLRQAELESEKLKRDEYISISKNKMEKIDSDIGSLQAQEKVARERFERVSDLFKKGIMIRPRMEEASDRLAELTTLLNKARINQKERAQQFESVLAGHFYDGNQVVGRLRETEATVQRASVEVDLAIEELQAMQQRRQVNKVTAAHDARVLKVLRQEGAAVKRGDTMLVVERLDDRVIHAFLRQDEATRVAIGDEAMVYVPALRAKAVARVTGVERNAAFLDDIDARYSWKQARDGGPKPTDKDRTARVTLKFDGPDKAIVDGKFEIGMPTVVSFQRRSVNTVFSSFSDVGHKL